MVARTVLEYLKPEVFNDQILERYRKLHHHRGGQRMYHEFLIGEDLAGACRRSAVVTNPVQARVMRGLLVRGAAIMGQLLTHQSAFSWSSRTLEFVFILVSSSSHPPPSAAHRLAHPLKPTASWISLFELLLHTYLLELKIFRFIMFYCLVLTP